MFKGFTWAKFLADVTTAASVIAGPLAGFVGPKIAAIGVAVGVAVRAVASLVTTLTSGTATDASGKPVSGQ